MYYSEISEEDVDAHIMTNARGSPPLDILVRTSGVKRLSDYLLWQVCQQSIGACIHWLIRCRAAKTRKSNTQTVIGQTSIYGTFCLFSWTTSARFGLISRPWTSMFVLPTSIFLDLQTFVTLITVHIPCSYCNNLLVLQAQF